MRRQRYILTADVKFISGKTLKRHTLAYLDGFFFGDMPVLDAQGHLYLVDVGMARPLLSRREELKARVKWWKEGKQ